LAPEFAAELAGELLLDAELPETADEAHAVTVRPRTPASAAPFHMVDRC
jgi:hypothetical protein